MKTTPTNTNCGVIVYNIEENKLDGQWVAPDKRYGTEEATKKSNGAESGNDNLIGNYDVTIIQEFPNKSISKGTLEITAFLESKRDTYKLTWNLDSGECEGIGMKSGEKLGATFCYSKRS